MAALKINPAPLPQTPQPSSRRRVRWKKVFKRFAWGGLGLLVIFLIVLFLLPIWISNEQGRTYVLQRINARLRAAAPNPDNAAILAIENWSLGWFHGTQLQNVSLSLPDGTRLLSCPHIESDLTLWNIVWGNYDIGNTRIDTAQFRLVKYQSPDGSTSLDSLAGLQKIFRTLRGSLQIGSAALILNSQATGESLIYSDLQTDITIASAKAPFHVQITAVGDQGQTLSYNATLPALARWSSAPRLALLAETELIATRLPTALVCDFLNLDPRWSLSLGDTLEHLRWICRDAAPLDSSYPVLDILGTEGEGGAAIDCRLVLQRPAKKAPPILLIPPDSPSYAVASLKLSPPLVGLLRRINPVFASLEHVDGLVTLTLTDTTFPVDRPLDVQATARLSFPPSPSALTFARSGILADLLNISAPSSVPTSIVATAEPFRFHAADGMISYDHVVLDCGPPLSRQRLTFTGSISLSGTCTLMATVPAPPPASFGPFASSTADIPITGRFDAPQVQGQRIWRSEPRP
ncbi:MAG: hypothetical protein FWD61_06415 [Phycisphaerales bacterium]|nr:hypothetical protein [Phycisphaerales bacterium]